MEDFLVSDQIFIDSHKGGYSVAFNKKGFEELNEKPLNDAIYIVDKNVAQIYGSSLENILDKERCLIIEALEENKSLDCFPAYIDTLVELKVRREQTLVAIGGGIVQDVAAFTANIIKRGVYSFYCSLKSRINCLIVS